MIESPSFDRIGQKPHARFHCAVAAVEPLVVGSWTVRLADGGAQRFDTLMAATGYEVHLPFLCAGLAREMRRARRQKRGSAGGATLPGAAPQHG